MWAAALFAVLRAGATAVPIDVAHAPELVSRLASGLDLAAWIGDTELPVPELDAKIVRLEAGWRPLQGPRDMPPFPPDDPGREAQIVLTSGTTGTPQSVAIRHENLRAVLDTLEGEIAAYRWPIRLAPRLRLAVSLPLSHLYGQFMGVLLPVALGADVAMIDTMSAAELAGALRQERAWALVSVPHTLSSLLHYLLDEERRAVGDAELRRKLEQAATLSWPRRWLLFARLRRRLGRRMVAVISGGASLDPEVERLWRLLGYAVVQGYGLTEAAPLVTLNHPLRSRPGSVGKPLSGVEVRLAADGEILVRGPNVATPSAGGPQIDTDGWLHTGDFGEELEDGSIGFRGRGSDRIVTAAGVNVDPAEVSAALRAGERILDAFVVEQPWGERGTLCAVLVVYPGADVDALVRETNRSLAGAARLRAWFVWPRGDLPRTPTGKVRRDEVMAWLKRQAPDAGGDMQASGTRDATPVEKVVAAIGGTAAPAIAPRDESDRLPADAPIGELLSSLERVELAARLEQLYGARIDERLFAGEQTIDELAASLLHRATKRMQKEKSAGSHREPRGARREERRILQPARRTDREKTTPPSATQRSPDPAHWRYWHAVRMARWVMRECVVHPLARYFVRIEADIDPDARQLDGPFLLAANHTSPMDPVVQFALPARTRARLAPAARWNFFANHRIGRRLYLWCVLGLNVFPLVQDGDWRPTLRIGGELADRGHSILIYPEGEMSKDQQIQPFKQGVAVMARDLHLPIVPCATAGLERVVPPGSRRARRRESWRRPVMAVCIGEPMPAPRPGDDLDATVAELERRVRTLHERARALAQAPRMAARA